MLSIGKGNSISSFVTECGEPEKTLDWVSCLFDDPALFPFKKQKNKLLHIHAAQRHFCLFQLGNSLANLALALLDLFIDI